MKRTIFMLLLAVTMFNCSTDDTTTTDNIPEATLLGRWNLVGFEGLVLYQFTEDKRYTMYASDGVFETLDEVIDSGRTGNDWWYDGDNVTIDLNFGNTSTLTPQFVCDNYVINWLNADGEIHSTLFREDFDYSSCTE